MSGPIVRKYGFPNFEKIFGERDIKHGGEPPKPADEPAEPAQGEPQADASPAPVEPPKP